MSHKFVYSAVIVVESFAKQAIKNVIFYSF